MHEIIQRIKKHSFMFEELVKRDFKQKYKRTVLGMVWSILNPLLTLLVMRVVFTQFYGRNQPFYTTYLFAGNLMYAYYKESTNGGMNSLMSNASIFTKINVPKYLFLLSKNVSAVINFGLTLVIFFVFVAVDGIAFHFRFLMIIYPIVCLIIFNIGCGFILSALFVIFKDVQYLYDIFTLMLMYLSAIFYYTDTYSENVQRIFYLNPLYVYITYIRHLIIDGYIPGVATHALCLFYAVAVLAIGALIYKKYNYKFMYYM